MPQWMWFLVVGVTGLGGLVLAAIRLREEDQQIRAAVVVGALTAAVLAVVIFWPVDGLIAFSVARQLDGMILFGFLLLLVVNVLVTVILISIIVQRVYFTPRWFKYFFWFTGSLAGIGLGSHWLMIYPSVVLFGYSFIQLFFPNELIVDIRRDRQRRIEEQRD